MNHALTTSVAGSARVDERIPVDFEEKGDSKQKVLYSPSLNLCLRSSIGNL